MTDTENLKVALITGGGTGIGRAVSMALADSGFAVVLAGRRKEPLEEVASEISRMGQRALAVAADVADEQSTRALFAWLQWKGYCLDTYQAIWGLGL